MTHDEIFIALEEINVLSNVINKLDDKVVFANVLEEASKARTQRIRRVAIDTGATLRAVEVASKLTLSDDGMEYVINDGPLHRDDEVISRVSRVGQRVKSVLNDRTNILTYTIKDWDIQRVRIHTEGEYPVQVLDFNVKFK